MSFWIGKKRTSFASVPGWPKPRQTSVRRTFVMRDGKLVEQGVEQQAGDHVPGVLVDEETQAELDRVRRRDG